MFIAIISYHLICFTDFIPANEDGLEARNKMGYSFVGWVVLMTTTNLYFLVKEFGKQFKLNAIKKFNQHKKQFHSMKTKVKSFIGKPEEEEQNLEPIVISVRDLSANEVLVNASLEDVNQS